ncbi:MAG: hypothetical protein QM754_04815 [Tepidisphaeraceae bacterium]
MQTPDQSATAKAAAKIITDAMLAAGMEPARAIDHPVVQGVIRKWLEGDWTQAETIDACRDLLMIYPQLRV